MLFVSRPEKRGKKRRGGGRECSRIWSEHWEKERKKKRREGGKERAFAGRRLTPSRGGGETRVTKREKGRHLGGPLLLKRGEKWIGRSLLLFEREREGEKKRRGERFPFSLLLPQKKKDALFSL